MLTITAPGQDRHTMWDPGNVRGSRPECHCHEVEPDLGVWNASASARWNRLRTSLSRLVPDLAYLRAVEVQKRGALHLHVLIHSSAPLDVLMLQRAAVAAGFGCVLDLAHVEPGSRKHAYYVSKYVTKACDARESVPWKVREVDTETGEILETRRDASYRTWSASRDWGLTMAMLKAVSSAQARARAARLREAGELAEAGRLAPPSGDAIAESDPPPT
jgi:hypothetical protein